MADPMFTLCGQVANVFIQPGGTSKKTGEAFDPRDKVQILGSIPLAAGGHKLELVTLNVEDATVFKAWSTRLSACLSASTASVKPSVTSSLREQSRFRHKPLLRKR